VIGLLLPVKDLFPGVKELLFKVKELFQGVKKNR
jgi:hypothetical protein